MEKLTKKLKDNIEGVKSVLSAKDILVYEFLTGDGTECAIVYTDGMVDKALLGDLAARPLSKLTPENKEKGFTLEEVKQTLLFPELKVRRSCKTSLPKCWTATVSFSSMAWRQV